MLVLTFKALNGLGPLYLWDCLFPYSPQRALRSADQNLLRVPGPKKIKLASTRARAFSALAPAWWNALPSEIRARWELSQFRRACKTELFRQAYGGGQIHALPSWPASHKTHILNNNRECSNLPPSIRNV